MINESDEIDIGIPIDEAADPEVVEAMNELRIMQKWVNAYASGDGSDGKVNYDFATFRMAIKYRAQGKSLNTTVELRDNMHNNTKRSVNLGEEAEKQLRAYINSCQRQLNGTSYRVAHTVTGDQKFTNDEDKYLNQKYGGDHALKAAMDAANRLLNLIHKWRTRYR